MIKSMGLVQGSYEHAFKALIATTAYRPYHSFRAAQGNELSAMSVVAFGQ